MATGIVVCGWVPLPPPTLYSLLEFLNIQWGLGTEPTL
jgi:hypothetical protein